MTEQAYRAIFAWLEHHEQIKQAVLTCNAGLRWVGYLAYPALLAYSAYAMPQRFVFALIVPIIGFVLVTVVRAALDFQRPYEQFGFEPLVPKNTKGHSFPSRHVCSLVLIAGAWLYVNIAVGVALLMLAAVLAALRVVCGVHFPRDCIAGYIFGLACTLPILPFL